MMPFWYLFLDPHLSTHFKYRCPDFCYAEFGHKYLNYLAHEMMLYDWGKG